jgi:hypothetical protein
MFETTTLSSPILVSYLDDPVVTVTAIKDDPVVTVTAIKDDLVVTVTTIKDSGGSDSEHN